MSEVPERAFRLNDVVEHIDGSLATIIHEQELALADFVWVRFHGSGREVPMPIANLRPKPVERPIRVRR